MEYAAEFMSSFEEVDAQVNKVCSILEMSEDKPSQDFLFICNYVLRELLNNAVEHGNRMVKENKVKYHVQYRSDRIEIDVWDQGHGFNLKDRIKEIKENKEPLRDRNRGLASLIEIGFQLSEIKGGISTVYLFDRQNIQMEGEDKQMEILMEDRKLVCRLHTNLVSMNIKALIEELKPHIEKTDNFDSIRMNLKEVSGIDSMGITFLIGIYKTLLSSKKKLVLCEVAQPMQNLFKIMKLDEIFEIDNT